MKVPQTKKTEAYIQIIALSVFAVLLCAVLIDFYRFRVCFKAAENIPAFSDAVPLRFLIYGSGGDTVSAVFYLYNSNNEELATIERSWKGENLAVDFVGAQFGGKTVYFPRSVCGYTAGFFPLHPSRSGTRLSRYYMQKRCCLLYDFDGCEKDFFRLARYALRPMFGFSQPLVGALHSRQLTLGLAACEPGKTYAVKTGSNGQLEITTE